MSSFTSARRSRLAGRDLADMEHRVAGEVLEWLGRAILRQRKHGRGARAEFGGGDGSERQRRRAERFGEIGEAHSAVDLGPGGRGGCRVLEIELLDVAFFRNEVGVLRIGFPAFEFRGDLGVGHAGLAHQVIRRHHRIGHRAIVRHAETVGMLFDEGVQLRVGRIGDGGEGGFRHFHILHRAALVHVGKQRAAESGGHREAVAHRADQLLADAVLAHGFDESLLVEAVLLQALQERRAIERAERSVDGGQRADRCGNLRVAHDKAEVLRGAVERGLVDQGLQGAVREAGLLSFLRCQVGTALDARVVHHVLVVAREVLGGDLGAADAGHTGVVRAAAEDVADPPQDEAEHQPDKQNLDGPGLGELAHCLKHDGDPNVAMKGGG